MRWHATRLAAVILALGPGTLAQPAAGQSPTEGRIVHVKHEVVFDGRTRADSTWGFHLAHMRDGRYCVRLGDTGPTLTLATMEKSADFCFAGIPGVAERSLEHPMWAFDTTPKPIAISTKGSIDSTGDDFTLTITSCTRSPGEAETLCFPYRFVVHMKGAECSAEVALARGKARATSCQHYEAR